jgi:hypothetical protein
MPRIPLPQAIRRQLTKMIATQTNDYLSEHCLSYYLMEHCASCSPQMPDRKGLLNRHKQGTRDKPEERQARASSRVVHQPGDERRHGTTHHDEHAAPLERRRAASHKSRSRRSSKPSPSQTNQSKGGGFGQHRPAEARRPPARFATCAPASSSTARPINRTKSTTPYLSIRDYRRRTVIRDHGGLS